MWRIVLCCLLICMISCHAVTDKQFKELAEKVKALETNYNVRTAQFVALARQVSIQQLYVEETTRSGGDSGIKTTRLTRTGSKSYFSNTFSGRRVMSIHDHSNYRTTCGMGEFVAVLNGVEFRTRHNDYKMVMPSTTSSVYGRVETVPFPAVPPEVLAQPTVEQQAQELKEWFKAWLNSDIKKRDYRKYFKANLCYLEGMWTDADSGSIEEPFPSDRHAIDAKSFFDLLEKIKFTSLSGRKSLKENYSFLPTMISDIDEFGNVKIAQWNYKIMCHPLKRDVPLSRFRLVDDLFNRVAEGKSLEDYAGTRAARFGLYEDPRDTMRFSKKDTFTRDNVGSFIDELMNEIPGKDNYQAYIHDDAFNRTAYGRVNINVEPRPDPLNVGYYHNVYKLDKNDAMGASLVRRGYNDGNLYVAYNTQSKITPTKVKTCTRNRLCRKKARKSGKCSKDICTEFIARVSYAIPLEIVYTTPLQSWNPFNLTYFADNRLVETTGMTGSTRRNGGKTKETAFAGISNSKFYMTPAMFFSDTRTGKKDSADTAKFSVGVLDKKGLVREMSPSGIHIFLKNIPDVGTVRLRYPIMPIHEAGSAVYKEVEALKDISLRKLQYGRLYPNVANTNGSFEEVYTFELNPGTKYPTPGYHTHTVDISQDELEVLKAGKVMTFQTSTDNGHDHEVQLKLTKNKKYLFAVTCDGKRNACWDGHKGNLQCPDCRFDPFA